MDKKTFATDEHRFSQISEKKESLALSVSVFICGEKIQGIAGRIACVTFRFCIYMSRLRRFSRAQHNAKQIRAL